MTDGKAALPSVPPAVAAPRAHRSVDWNARSQLLVFGVVSAIALVFLVAPTIVVLITSFTDAATLKFPPPAYSLRWYRALIDADQLQTAAWNSLRVAVSATALSVVIGTAGALVVSGSRSGWARAMDALLMSPLVLPALAFGFACLLYFSLIGLAPSVPLLIVGHTVVCFPYVMRTTIASLAQLDPGLLEASESLGAGRWLTFRRVTLPLIGKGVAAGAFIAFMASFDNVPVSLFLADARTELLPIHMWQIIDNDLDVRTAAVSGVLIAFTVILMLVAERFAGLTRQIGR
jgi:putative spermidine/putrescine transport system permease protein